MQFYKFFWILIILSALAFKLPSNKQLIARWVIAKDCSLKVGGSTTVNKFNCVIPEYARPDTISFYKGAIALTVLGSIKLGVNKFDCANSIMTKILRKTLQNEEFPNIDIRF